MRLFVLSCLALICGSADAQCVAADTGRVGPLVATTLPDSVLTYLERHQASPYVQAFLIAHVATSVPEGGLPRPVLARCAASFVGTGLDEPGRLADLLESLRADTLLAALRRAETARVRSVRNRQGLTGLLDYLEDRKDVDESAFSGDVAFALQRLPDGPTCLGPCVQLRDALDAVAAKTDALQTQETALRDAEAALRAARADRDGATTRLAIAVDSLDAACEALPDDAPPCPSPTAPAEGCPTAHPALDACEAVQTARTDAETERGQFDVKNEALRQAAAAQQTARDDRDLATAQLYRVLWGVRDELTATESATTVLRTAAAPSAGVNVDPRFQRPDREATPLAAEAADPPPADLLVGLTDFVIDRARQESVYSFIQTLYDRMRPSADSATSEERPLLQSMFQDTYRLMDALADGDRADRRLPIRQAAQVPLATWRATLRSDFEALPVRLATDRDLGLCPASSDRCAASLATAGVALRVGARVLDGEPVFAALVETMGAPFPDGPAFEGREEIAFALGVVSALAEAYRIQGQAGPGTASPLLLTPRALGASGQKTGDALLRVVLGRAAPVVGAAALDVAPADFEAAVRHSVDRIETLATMLRPAADGERPSAAATLRAALAVVESGVRVGRVSGLDADRLDRVDALWTEADQAAAALARREYGLALARTARLLSTVRGGDHPLPTRATELLGLASALAEARTQGDLRTAFEAAASPIGGWEAKRYGTGKRNDGARLTLTAYPGAGLGSEALVRDIDTVGDVVEEAGLAVGVALPVGLHYSLTRGDDTARDWSWGLFLPVLDLGTLASARLADDDVEAVANTSVQQVFAPGLFLTAGAKSVPLTFTLGPQFVPNLRTSGPDAPAQSVVQFRFSVGLDVVLFEF